MPTKGYTYMNGECLIEVEIRERAAAWAGEVSLIQDLC
jgi:hypothetical protein